MSSFTRRLQRKALRAGKFTSDADGNPVRIEHEPQPQLIITGDQHYLGRNRAMRRAFARSLAGGYVTVRYTRGPLRVSAARLRAQARLAEIQHPGAMRQQAAELDRMMNGSRAKPRKVWGEPRAAVPGVVTRQQIRFARRKGLPIPGTEGTGSDKPKRSRAKKADAPAQAA